MDYYKDDTIQMALKANAGKSINTNQPEYIFKELTF